METPKNMCTEPCIKGENKEQARRRIIAQVLAVAAKNLLLVAHGLTIGFTTILIPKLKEGEHGETITLNDDQASWIGSIGSLGITIGCLCSGFLTQPIGRRRSMILSNIPFIVSWIILFFCDDVWQIYLSLAISGLAGGLIEAPVLVYVAEISQPYLRGTLASTSSFCTLIGVIIQFSLGSVLSWRTAALVSCIPHILSSLVLFFVPESPHWYIMKNRMDEARQSLAWLRGWTTTSKIEAEFQTLLDTAKKVNLEKKSQFKSKLEPYKKRRFLHPLGLLTWLFFLLHFTGVTSLQTYGVLLLQTFKVPIDSYEALPLMGVAQFVGGLLSVLLIKQVGKRILMLSSLLFTAICFITVATHAYLENIKYIVENTNNETNKDGWLPLVAFLLVGVSMAGGVRIVSWILVGESFARETRSNASGFAAAIAHGLEFIANYIFLHTVSSFTLCRVYWIHGGVGIVGAIVLYFWLPETEGKTLQEISDHFAGKINIGKYVRRQSPTSRFHQNENTITESGLEAIVSHDSERKL